MSHRRFETVILDVDSTLSGIEGVDWLAARRGPEVAAEIARLTERAMSGEIALDAIYGLRLDLIRPTAAEVEALARAYAAAAAPGAAGAIDRMRGAGCRVVVVSGGIRAAIVPFVATLAVDDSDVHAVRVVFDDGGRYAGFDVASPMTTQGGKRTLVEGLALARPSLMVGDGATDAAVRPAVDAFAAFTGFVRRDSVVRVADHAIASFDQLLEIVLP